MEYGMDKREEKRRTYREQYGKVIKRKRTGKNITQMELAEELGISRTTVSRYEKGELEMPASLLPLISDVCSFRFADYMADFDLVLLSKRRFLSWEDPLEKEQATHSSILGLPSWLC